jgi:hypothetical protein
MLFYVSKVLCRDDRFIMSDLKYSCFTGLYKGKFSLEVGEIGIIINSSHTSVNLLALTL